MDPSMMKTMDYFGQNMDPAGRQNAEASSSTAPPPVTTDASLWDPTLSLGMSDEIATSIPYGQQTASSSHGIHYGSLAGPQPYGTPSVSQAPVAPSIATSRKREGHDRKRAKVDNDAAALESVDYWIHLDDDDLDNKLGGSFEIDFSKRRNDTANYARPAASTFNTMASTPGLGTGLYTNSNTALFKDDFVDDSALDNALSDDEDGLDSLNLAEQLSKIDTTAPTEVPPREGLYSTPLSWEKPQPGLRSDPLLGAFNPSTPLLSDAEQKKLLAIALNTSRPPPPTFGGGFGSGLNFGYGYDALNTGFPTLGANTLMETLGANNMGNMSKPVQRPKPQPQPQPQTPAQSQVQIPAQPQNEHSRASSQAQTPNQFNGPHQSPQSQISQHSLQQPQPQPQRPPAPSQTPQSQSQIHSQNQTPAPQPDLQSQSQPHSHPGSIEEESVNEAAKFGTTDSEKGKEKFKTGDRAAHNDIERKYRTNLKDKISELRDSVPALRAIREEGADDGDEGSAQQRPPKVSKGTVLTKATEYIHFLERRNKAIVREHQDLSRRLQAFEQLLNATARQPFPMPNYSRALFDPRGFC